MLRLESEEFTRGFKEGMKRARRVVAAEQICQEEKIFSRTRSGLRLAVSALSKSIDTYRGLDRVVKLCPCGYESECQIWCSHPGDPDGNHKCPPWPEDVVHERPPTEGDLP